MSSLSRAVARRGVASALLAVAWASPQSALAAGGGLFDKLAGYWAGSGTVADSKGHSEPIRCKVTYAVSGDKTGLNQSLTCASASYKFSVASTIYDRGGRLSGQWTERTRNATGTVTGSISGDQIVTSVAGPGFTATLSIAMRGNAQSVSIRPQGTDVTSISINLKRTS